VTNIDFIVPSYHSKALTSLCISSFEQHKGDFNFRYIVVENSDDTSYKSDILKLSENIKWVQNPIRFRNSEANASAIVTALEHIESEYVFICHNDVVACHPDWMKHLFSKLSEQCPVVGTVLDNIRINAVHISGLLTYTKIAKEVEMFPIYEDGRQVADVGDMFTDYCRNNNLDYYCCENTHNKPELEKSCKIPYNELSYVDRAFDDDGKIVFLHLGRGSPKTFGTYNKDNRMKLHGWVEFIERNIFNGRKIF